jgi:hypothetical protein
MPGTTRVALYNHFGSVQHAGGVIADAALEANSAHVEDRNAKVVPGIRVKDRDLFTLCSQILETNV